MADKVGPAENPNGEKRQISTVAGVVITVALGAAMAYFGFGLLALGISAFAEDEVLIGVLCVLFGVALLGITIAVLVSQVMAFLRRRR
jgi:biotin transporter BioY